jgi:Asp-tRNA(Asn)/Glu-tRNA(Gln) amidotransferase A subunit family amidase
VDYEAALSQRAEARRVMADLLGDRVALCPATVDVAPRLGEGTGSRAPQRLWSLVGFPVVTVPALWRDGLPFGLQVVGRSGAESALWTVAESVSG